MCSVVLYGCGRIVQFRLVTVGIGDAYLRLNWNKHKTLSIIFIYVYYIYNYTLSLTFCLPSVALIVSYLILSCHCPGISKWLEVYFRGFWLWLFFGVGLWIYVIAVVRVWAVWSRNNIIPNVKRSWFLLVYISVNNWMTELSYFCILSCKICLEQVALDPSIDEPTLNNYIELMSIFIRTIHCCNELIEPCVGSLRWVNYQTSHVVCLPVCLPADRRARIKIEVPLGSTRMQPNCKVYMNVYLSIIAYSLTLISET